MGRSNIIINNFYSIACFTVSLDAATVGQRSDLLPPSHLILYDLTKC